MNLYNEVMEERPVYHHYPQKGLLNDPNGLIQWQGVYHLFYQLNPHGTTHQTKCWGHSVSRDLIHWERKPIALEPTDWFDQDGCYSGSAIAFEGTLYLFYTGNVINENKERRSYQCLATSTDGITFQKLGPIIGELAAYTAHVRDPKVWRTATGHWQMVLGAQRLNETGCLLIYQSRDLLEWFFVGELAPALGDFGYMWECPDLIAKQAESLLIFSPQGLRADGLKYQNIYQSGYLIGNYNDKISFTAVSEFRELDRGFEFYAPQTFEDEQGRLLLYGWMGAMSPEVEQALPSIDQGWVHTLTLPREIVRSGDKLFQKPIKELEGLRKKTLLVGEQLTKVCQLESYENELILILETDYQDLLLEIYQDVQVHWQSANKVLTLSRTNWLTKVREQRSVVLESSLKELRFFLEKNSLELFVNQGAEVFSLRMYHENNQPVLKIIKGNELIKEVIAYQLGY